MFPHETVVYRVTAPFLCYVHCDMGRMVLAGIFSKKNHAGTAFSIPSRD